MNEKLSALMDGELPAEETSAVVDALAADLGLQQAWAEFHEIGDAIRATETPPVDVTEAVMAALDADPPCDESETAQSEAPKQTKPRQPSM